MSTWRICAVAALVGSLGGCDGNGGAVSVRWRISNLSTGQMFDPMSTASNEGSCCSDLNEAKQCSVTSIWVVESVSVVLRDPSTGLAVPGITPPSYQCKLREATTAFDLPTGTYEIGLSADVFDGMHNPAPSVIPPPEVRTIVRGDVVNLQDIEIGVQPLPPARSVVTF
jgi:hypothetical protein